MAWSISITAEGWQEIRQELEKWERDDLIEAICDDRFEAIYEKAGPEHAQRAFDAEKKRLQNLPHDVLVDRAFELIEANDTSENGGFGYWIDREGFHVVWLPERSQYLLAMSHGEVFGDNLINHPVSLAFVSKLNALCRMTTERELAAFDAIDKIRRGQTTEYEVIPL